MAKTNNLTQLNTQCCIVGGGPAGLMLGFLLARSGVNTIVLEKHNDFLRDFRGDTVHPSTMELLHELGILKEFLQQPHQPIAKASFVIDGKVVAGPDFSHLPTQAKFIAMMPQWDFLNFIAEQALKYSYFQLQMATEATGLLEENASIKGVIAQTQQGTIEVRADLVVAADGRSSTVRRLSGLQVIEEGVPIDVLWFRLPKPNADMTETLAQIKNSHFLVMLNRGSYYQNAMSIHKGGFEQIKANGLAAFKTLITTIVPELTPVVDSIETWDNIKLLNVQVNHLERWYRKGLLCIGDAAHAMSPIGGVGVNYAVQDAVATTNLLAEKLRQNQCGEVDLAKVQKRREWPARLMQRLQIMAHQRFFSGEENTQVVAVSKPLGKVLRLFAALLRRLASRIIGLGFRPEHIQTQEHR